MTSSPRAEIELTVEGAVTDSSVRTALKRRCHLVVALIALLLLAVIAISVLAVQLAQGDRCSTDVLRVVASSQAATVGDACSAHGHIGKLEMPAGMAAQIYVCDLVAPRQLTPARIHGVGDVLFIGSRKWKSNTSVYAVVDAEADGVADTVFTIDSGLDQPNGVEWLAGSLYVATARALLRYDGVREVLRGMETHTTRHVLNPRAFPALTSLQWHYLRANASGTLFASNSAGCDHCVPSSSEAAAIVTLDQGTCFSPVVHTRGVRFSVGFTFDAAHGGALIFTNNGHDSIDGDDPYDTVNRAASPGLDFGFPHCYATRASRLEASNAGHLTTQSGSSTGYNQPPATARDATCAAYASGTAIGSHVAPLGVTFRDPDTLLIAERGAFGGPPVGHRISTVNAQLGGYTPLISGFIDAGSGMSWGRPVDVQMAPGGAADAFFVSDDKSNSVLRFVATRTQSPA